MALALYGSAGSFCFGLGLESVAGQLCVLATGRRFSISVREVPLLGGSGNRAGFNSSL